MLSWKKLILLVLPIQCTIWQKQRQQILKVECSLVFFFVNVCDTYIDNVFFLLKIQKLQNDLPFYKKTAPRKIGTFFGRAPEKFFT